MTNPKIIVLLGMHRSGTSLCASILEALGVDFGSDFIPADASNPKGYFENAAITRAQVRLNRVLNRKPFTAAGLVDYPEQCWHSRQALEFVDEAEMLVRKELERSNGIWGFKDPHTIKLLPLWQIVFERLVITPVYVLAVRHPSEVVASAVKRDHVDPDQVEIMWADQNVAALYNTGFNITAVLDYAAWFSDLLPQARRLMDALGLECSGDNADLQATLDDRIDSRLRRQIHAGNARSPFVQELYQQLQAVSTGADLRQATVSLVNRYRSAKQLFDPAWKLLDREYRLRKEKEQELRTLKRKLDSIKRITNTFTGTRSGALLQKYQIFRRRISNQSAGGAPLVLLQRILDKE